MTDVRRSSAQFDNVAKMSLAVADVFIAKSVIRNLKQSGACYGVYNVQCTEGSSSAATADDKRVAALNNEFRLRQTGASGRYADFYSTRRLAFINAQGAHYAEMSAVKFAATACARNVAKAESLRACDRYILSETAAEEYMHKCVNMQYQATRVPGGVFSTRCADGTAKGQAETSRIAALSANYRAGLMSTKDVAGMRYNASLHAVHTARGCTYEEVQFMEFPKMAGAMRCGDGSYAASVGGAAAAGGVSTEASGKLAALEVRLNTENAAAIWPSSEIRKAIPRRTKPWMPSSVKDYSPMSQAAVAYGVAAQSNAYEEPGYTGKWTSGWQPKSSVGPK